MVSPVVAQAILSQRAPDVLGAFERGREQQRQSDIRELSGQAFAGQEGALKELAGIEPAIALQIGESIRAKDAKDIDEFIRDARIGQNLLQSNPQGFITFADQRIQQIMARGGDPTQTRRIRQLAMVNPAEAIKELQSFTAAVDGSKQLTEKEIAETKKIEAETDKIKVETAQARKKLEGLAEKPDLKLSELRNIQSDVEKLIAEPKKIRNAAARLEKIGETKTATDQLAAIFTFMKALDPTSVVREGEQEQARATGGISDQLIGFVNRIQGEGALPPEVFNEMTATAKRIANQAVTDSNREVVGFLDTFDEHLPPAIRRKTLARLPKTFENGDGNNTGQVQQIGRFQVRTK